jgi:putative membrane protein
MRLAPLMAGVALVALMAQPGLAQNQDTTKPPQAMPATQTQQLAQADVDFAKTAAGAGMAEVKLGKLAEQQAQSEQVKQFGQRMVTDHTKANDQLKAIAEKKKIDLPQSPPDAAQKAYDDLQKKSGQEFDQAFMDTMVKDHHKAVDLFQQEAKSGKDADLQGFAKATLPTLQQHLELAQKTQEQVMASNDAGATKDPAAASTPAPTPPDMKDQPQAANAPATNEPATPKTPAAGTTAAAGAAAAMTDQPQATAEPAMPKTPATGAVTPKQDQQEAANEPAMAPAGQPTGDQIRAQDVIGTGVINNKGDKVGKITDLVIDQNKIEYAVVSVGGFLGIGDKDVAIPLDQLKLGKDKSYLLSAETEDQLKQMPEYQYKPRS